MKTATSPASLGKFTPEQLDWAIEWVFRHPNDTSPSTARATALLVEGVKFYKAAHQAMEATIKALSASLEARTDRGPGYHDHR